MRVILITFILMLITACSASRTPEKAYKEGKYLESVELITQYVEERGEAKLNADDLDRFRRIVMDVMSHYENQLLSADRKDYPSRINSYESLLTMKVRLSNQFYSQQVYFFNNKYDIKPLRQLIAEEYYLYGNSINANDAESYNLKATAYRKGMEQYKYKDIETLYRKTYNTYMQVAANEYYNQAKQFAEMENYKAASEYFLKTVEVYKPLGKYKDSDKLFSIYDKKYRTIEAEQFYQQAEQLQRIANTRFEYREIATLYKNASDIYKPYGAYRDAGNLATKYRQQGMIKVSYSATTQYTSDIEKALKADYISIVSNRAVADVNITISQRERYTEPKPTTNVNAMSENLVDKMVSVVNSEGKSELKPIYKTYYFNRQVIEKENKMVLKTNIYITGLYRYNEDFTVTKTSNSKEYLYTGDVPSKYKNSSKDKLLSERQLRNKAQSAMDIKVNDELKAISRILERL